MSTSRYIARLMGPILLIMGLGMVIEHETVSKLSQEFLSNLSLIYLAGILTLLAGLAIVNAHNVWTQDWRVIITVLGWLGVLGGLFRILLPSQVRTLGTGFATNANAMIIGGIFVLVIGAILAWQGYVHVLQGQRPQPAARAPRRAAKRAAPARKA
ncbi:MAG: hypothetical protein ACRECX_14920, partial [Methyloceanibacter sp.]|uniref:hypothetical protein n=1 Tax=Methyloceanibacter sp. TaxID=1965321 RepID=UPI003D6CCF7C